MSLTLIESDGNLQHAQEFYDEEGEMLLTQFQFWMKMEKWPLPAFVYVMLMSQANVVALQQLGRIGIMKNIIGMKSRRN